TAEVTHPSQIAQSFDEISYGKGASVLRMIEAYLGEETFRRGVSDYLHRFRNGNARSQDLWDALDRAAGEPIHPMLEQWLNRPGLPILSVSEDPAGLSIRQRRYALTGNHRDEHWPIPIVARINGELRRFRFDTPSMRIDLPTLDSLDFNPNAAGFYRVLYDGPCYDRVLRDFATRSPADQWAVVQDLYAFLFSGDVTLERFADFVRASESLTGYLPVRELAEDLPSLHRIIGDHPAIAEAARSFLHYQYERLGADRRRGEPETDGVLRERVATALLWFDPNFAQELASRFAEVPHVDPDLRPAVSLAFARTGGADAYVALRRAAEAARSEGEALEYEVALASCRDPSLVEATYQLLDDGVLNRAHLPQIVRPAAHNPEGRAVTWAWMTRRLEAVGRENRGTGFASYVYEYALPFVGLEHPEEVTRWVAMHPVLEGDRGAKKGLALLDGTRSLRNRFGVH
ncbi:MAG: ERAP1-like C-terminal domain-containing protein, partial [Thermoplasmata archaeon]|nr:ERAP1-like C-terminal domain-containing protein [Thermoplasmata archaeon]